MKQRIWTCMICFMCIVSSFNIVFAERNSYGENMIIEQELKSEQPISMKDINSDKVETIYLSDETVFVPEKISDITYTFGKYPIYTRIQTTKSASNGVAVCSSKTGKYSSIASFALSFFKNVPAMRISQIFSVVSLAVDSNQYSQAKTMKSYIDYRKNGQARWADESYSTYVCSGRREYYKHVLAAKKNANETWSTKTKDYTDKPAAVDQGNYYKNSDSWFKEQARQRIQTGSILMDLPW